MNSSLAIWFPTVRTGTGTDVFTERLVADLQERGFRAEITWLPLRAEYAPWTVPIPQPPMWANVVHVNTWLHSRFLPRELPILATIHHAVHHQAVNAYKGILRAAYHRWWVAPNERRVICRADCVSAVSQFVAETAKNTLADVPIHVIYNSVDTDKFIPCARIGSRDKPFRLLFVGGWKVLKGVDLLAPIMRELGKDFELYYTGGTITAKEKKMLPPNMHNIGRLKGDAEVVSAMHSVDALIFPSRSEGFGLVAVEAMACGLPVIATRGSAITEVISDGHSGLLCSIDDIRNFSDAVKKLAADSLLYGSIARNGCQKVRLNFSKKMMVDRYEFIYSQILKKK